MLQSASSCGTRYAFSADDSWASSSNRFINFLQVWFNNFRSMAQTDAPCYDFGILALVE
jgi:hypothetical protein